MASVDRAAHRGQTCDRFPYRGFPGQSGRPTADGVSNLYASFKIAAETGRPHAMQAERYDVRDQSGAFVERYWRPVNTPLLDQEGRLIYLLHHVEDVTSEVLEHLISTVPPPTSRPHYLTASTDDAARRPLRPAMDRCR
jgi:hypothetical protein